MDSPTRSRTRSPHAARTSAAGEAREWERLVDAGAIPDRNPPPAPETARDPPRQRCAVPPPAPAAVPLRRRGRELAAGGA